MDPNQTSRSTPSGTSDIDPIGSNSGAGVTPVGLTGANNATETAPTQRIPPIGTSKQDQSLPINQTKIPERTGARVWNRHGDRPPSDDPIRSQSRPISPTHVAQTRGELTELRGMMTTLIDEIQSQRVTNQSLTNRLDQAERELAEYRAANVRERNRTPLDPLSPIRTIHGRKFTTTPTAGHRPPKFKLQWIGRNRTELQRPRSTPTQFHNGSTERQGEPRMRISPPNHSIPENRTPSATRTFHQAGLDNLTEQTRRHDHRGPINIDPQREDLEIQSETGTIQNYIERNDADLKRIHAIIHMATSSAPDIDMVIEETRRTPFTNRIASVRLHHVGKLKFPEYAGSTYPKAHVRAFRLAISRVHLTDDEKEAGYCRFFAENLTGAALEWFAGLEENSIYNFTQLVSTFLKQYSIFIETKVTKEDLWNLK
ncbi:uncharacterized protein LOC106407035 isoform X1 [Brassica napus]|uniref:uncharacterized protein LOC106407035 isoform X1 n=1 Tax=Brassica napus TaxID=3708 RepID=UPI002079F20E|nr:uncharacterized protein LOC106407035 isoform X1 [Brassica napus]XP_048609458.1 uncharacterized protein LOC106407035 isoform X1 [Brassica napus]